MKTARVLARGTDRELAWVSTATAFASHGIMMPVAAERIRAIAADPSGLRPGAECFLAALAAGEGGNSDNVPRPILLEAGEPICADSHLLAPKLEHLDEIWRGRADDDRPILTVQ